MRTPMIAAAAAAVLAGCMMDRAPSGSDRPRNRATRNWVEARPVGAPVDCVQINRIDRTRVRDDGTIDFYMRGGKVYRNLLPNGCPTLGFEEAFSYRTSISQLCSVDIITVVNRSGSGIAGPSCSLGPFQPVDLADGR